jgi:hypothetical protein
MRKAITLTLSVALLGVFAAVVVAAVGPSDDAASTMPAGATTETKGTTTAEVPTRRDAGVDISGPCDEAEHANDPRCAGVQVPRGAAGAPTPQPGVDISGPCDEAEHIGDPRCTGVGAGDAGRIDNSGPGSVHSERDDDFDDDRHGGRAHDGDDDAFDDHDDAVDDHGGDDFDDNSGHGGGDEDFDDDSSGSGDGDSGSGGGD